MVISLLNLVINKQKLHQKSIFIQHLVLIYLLKFDLLYKFLTILLYLEFFIIAIVVKKLKIS